MHKTWLSGMLASLIIVGCGGGLVGQGGPEMGPDVSATSFALSNTDFSGNSVRIVGERDPTADLKYDCASAFDMCLNFDENGETDVLLGLCASSAQPAGGWNFDYQVYYGEDCPTNAEMFDIECASTVNELLPAGIVTTNQISCGADNAGKTWDFDMSGENPACPVGKTCVVLGGENGGGGDTGPQALEYGGEAKGIDADLSGVGTTIVHAGPVGPSTGSDSESLASASVGPLRSGVVSASTIAASNKTLSQAQVAGLNLTLAGIGISATAISAEALATCTGTTPSIAATGLVINGSPIVLSGAPNQVLFDLLGVKITANVVDTTGTGGDTQTIRVAALQIENSLLGSVINTFTIAEAFSTVTCDN